MKKWITKTEEKKILSAYEVYRGEIVPYGDMEHCYEIKGIRNMNGQIVLIKIEQATNTMDDPPQILVKHSDGTGNTVCIDIWDRDTNGRLVWKYRNLAESPTIDRIVFENYERKISEMEKKIKQLQSELKSKKAFALDETILEKFSMETGRRPHPEKLDKKANEIKELLNQGKKDKEIIAKLEIGRATFYRLKKRLEKSFMDFKSFKEDTDDYVKEKYGSTEYISKCSLSKLKMLKLELSQRYLCKRPKDDVKKGQEYMKTIDSYVRRYINIFR